MRRSRRALLTFALIAVATMGLGACVAVNEVVTERDLACAATPDELCLRIADFFVREAPGEVSTDRATVNALQVAPADCEDVEPGLRATRCWWVSGTYTVGFADIPLTSEIVPTDIGMVLVYERLDGTLAVWQ